MQAECRVSVSETSVVEQRLDELNKWQAEQKNKLLLEQSKEREVLGRMIGMVLPDNYLQEAVKASDDDASSYGTLNENNNLRETAEPTTHRTSGYSSDEIDELPTKHTGTKPFLKRGEGLKQRFKIDPEALRLNNLPKYKYAKKRQTPLAAKPSMPCLQKQNSKNLAKAVKSESALILDAQEKRFQQMLITSKNMHNSTPDLKTCIASGSSSTSALPRVHFEEQPQKQQQAPLATAAAGNATRMTWSKVFDPQLITPIPVKTASLNYTDASTPARDEEDNLSLFELLEQKAKEGTIDVESSAIKNILQKRKQRIESEQDEEDYVTAPNSYVELGLAPLAHAYLGSDSSSDEDEHASNDDDDEPEEAVLAKPPTIAETHMLTDSPESNASTRVVQNQRPRVRFCEQQNTCEYIEEPSSDYSVVPAEEESTMLSEDNTGIFEEFKQALFSTLRERAERGELENLQTVVENTVADENDDEEMSLGAKSVGCFSQQELQEKTELIKARLNELEAELQTFRRNNAELTRAKQEHELEKCAFEQERIEILEKLEDAKVQAEIELHDKRMKLAEERRKLEQQIRVQKSALQNRERAEVARLKQEVETLQAQLRQKEQTHVEAQKRLRIHIGKLEREQRQQNDEIERLNKQNKKLEQNVTRVQRESNTKMLQEINSNIAKLAPKLTQEKSMRRSMSTETALNMNKKAAAGKKKVHVVSPKTTGSKVNNKHNKMPTAPPTTPRAALNRSDSTEEEASEEEAEYFINESSLDNDKHLAAAAKEKENRRSSCKQKLNNATTAATNVTTTTTTTAASTANAATKEVEIDHSAGGDTSKEYKREIINLDGSRDIIYPNGNLKKISADAMIIRMLYFNTDIKETNMNEGTVKYYYASTNTWHTTYLDGLEILEFPNGQTEHRHKNGLVEIHFPNNSMKIIDPSDKNKLEEWRFADGTNLLQMRNGDKILTLPNGQKEIHTKLSKRREYPDGTVKLVYPDGSQETRYSNGRIRLKDKTGKLVVDTGAAI